MERFRCNLCGRVFTASLPEGVRDRKYDETTATMIGLLKYGSGVPFNRLQGLEGNFGIPLPATTQWGIVNEASDDLTPAYREMVRLAADGEVVHNDDTGAKILAHMKENVERIGEFGKGKTRTGTFTTGIISRSGRRAIGLFFTGRRHSGENLNELLKERSEELDLPIQMSDAENRNTPNGKVRTKRAFCLAHGRRKFAEVADAFPGEVRTVLEEIRKVYRVDAQARRESLSAENRLALHRKESGPVMDALKEWFDEQINEKKVEPNSSLGEAIRYMRDHWEPLTLFLREPGAPLDNNPAERALKKPILHRKNAMFFKTENGARVADIFMSLIYTAEMAGTNTFEYITALLRHATAVRKAPAAWMPWNYVQALAVTSP
jgi:hypothetical protein